MKSWQFRILLVAILLQPIIMYFWWGYRIESIHYASNTENIKDIKEYLRNIDENVATLDGRIVWDVAPKVRDIEDYSLQTLEIITDKLY